MSKEIDLSKPLDEDTVRWLMQRRPKEVVDRLVFISQQNAPEDSGDVQEEGNGEDTEELNGDEDGNSFDPGEYTVDEVNDYLVTVSPDEAERVLELERNGKSRSGILNN